MSEQTLNGKTVVANDGYTPQEIRKILNRR